MSSLIGTRSLDAEARVEDYLNDKVQTAADFDTLDSLLQTVQHQQALLKKQLDEATDTLVDAQKASHDHEAAIQEKATQFSSQQNDIDRRLMIVTQSDSSDNAVKMLESSTSKLRRLDLAMGYMELLQEVKNLDSQARSSMKSSPRKAISPYIKLRSLLSALKNAQPAAEGAAPHLVDHVEKQTNKLYNEMKQSFENDFNSTLEMMGWPKKSLNLASDIVARWTDQVETLLDLQEPDLISRRSNTLISQEPSILLPLQVMIYPLDLRFRYHFSGDKPTNRSDHPEYFLSHTLDLLEDHNDFIYNHLQPIIDRKSRLTGIDDTLYTDATSAFITALLPMVSSKSLDLLPRISSQPQLLSHFIHELMSFDATLRESWAYTPVNDLLSDWKGLTWSMLTAHGYFNTWLGVEKEFALARYNSIMSAADRDQLDLDSTDPGTTKPTKAAIRVNDLLEEVTDRYRSLSSFSQKLRFLIDIQLEIFDQYHNEIYGSFQGYLLNTTRAGQLLQGSSAKARPEQDLSGIRGLESLCKIFGSAEYLERKMSDWSDDVFFLELWEELQDRAKQNSGPNGSLGHDLNTHEVASRTSATITNASTADVDGELEGGGLFDETAGAYHRLRVRAEEELINALKASVREIFRSYSRVSGWASLSATSSDLSMLSQTSALDGPIQVLTSYLSFLATTLAAAPLRRITRQVCAAIQKELWDNVLVRHTFSGTGVAQLKRDVTAIEDAIDTSIETGGEAQRGMRKLDEALTLLGLPIKSSGTVAEDDNDAEGWDFDQADEDGNINEDDDFTVTDEQKIWGLWEVEKRIFRSNESARDVLTQMGLELLTENEARSILERRVEISS